MRVVDFPIRPVSIVGYASGLGAVDGGCAEGPDALRAGGLVQRLRRRGVPARWDATLRARRFALESRDAGNARLLGRLARHVFELTRDGHLPLVVGGDHACAIGTWNGVADALEARGRLGLLWIDAHMDSHVPDTSPSNALHGMPLAALLGFGDARFSRLRSAEAVLRPAYVALVGVRSFERGEAALLQRLGVRVFAMEEVRVRGLAAVMDEALAIVRQAPAGYGATLDMDALDPATCPGVGSPVPRGLQPEAVGSAWRGLAGDPALRALELAEYNPTHDPEGKTLAVAIRLLCAALESGAAPRVVSAESGAQPRAASAMIIGG